MPNTTAVVEISVATPSFPGRMEREHGNGIAAPRRLGTSPTVAMTNELNGGEWQCSPRSLQDALFALTQAIQSALESDTACARHYAHAAYRWLGGGELRGGPIGVEDLAGPAISLGVAQTVTTDVRRGGLAPWQIKRVSTHIDAHLGETILCEDLARLVRLSLSYFMRAFRESFGCPPHSYLMKRRMERAQGLMLTTNAALGDIALDCGLADQSHLTRLFQRYVGDSPAAWRRARVTGGGPCSISSMGA